ncbi:MAG TPA: TrmH family RNA methyltransferase [Chloroflexota bacterium]|nr:TrmH family RNA methyltransferase [Chloroflexota bacterium]
MAAIRVLGFDGIVEEQYGMSPRIIRVDEENEEFRRLELLKRSQSTRHRVRQFFVEGVKAIDRAREHRWAVRALVYAQGGPMTPWGRETLAALPEATRIELSRPLMGWLSEKNEVSELVAIMAMPPDTTDRLRLGPVPLVAVVDRPSSPGNLGSIIRSSHAFGVDGVIVTGPGTDVYHPLTVRASMGSLFALPVVRLESHREVGRWIERLAAARSGPGRGARLQLVGAGAGASIPFTSVDLTRPAALVFGNEAKGLARGYRDMCDVVAAIPMERGADSVNVACAAAIALYETQRQRRELIR